ncbi:hypothetical protein LN040_11435 [Desulfovibrio subterraneus]|uniref:hypothetical protein n=1 Tax=Desulfovibrio subterraneus TaxID=2718620 RepID=UPI0022B8E3E8|nr:hypothetical protein [Desulfovibrio subterraneus]WBF66341.1 hypothetical protein LN040_11435 [Desulfovibrio subterraneus]
MLAESYIWKDALRLGAWIDHASGTRCLFHYEAGHSPAAVTMEHPQGAATYRLGFDQIGSLKLVVLPDANGGKLIKEMAYDSFGTMLNDSNPELFLPVGFASGLVDRHTGLIRFGYRDYSTELGRFTAGSICFGLPATHTATVICGITVWMIRSTASTRGGWKQKA